MKSKEKMLIDRILKNIAKIPDFKTGSLEKYSEDRPEYGGVLHGLQFVDIRNKTWYEWMKIEKYKKYDKPI